MHPVWPPWSDCELRNRRPMRISQPVPVPTCCFSRLRTFWISTIRSWLNLSDVGSGE